MILPLAFFLTREQRFTDMQCGIEARYRARLEASMWPQQQQWINGEVAEWLGDVHPLVQQLGSADGLAELHGLSESLQSCPVVDLTTLKNFLRLYHEQILLPHELPAIQAACSHAGRGELRELVALDQQVTANAALKDFASASRRVGCAQLQKLRPLRDERMVKRYLQAVENGEAHGWHTLVYGLTLAVYSLPLRQGLLGYAWQTTHGFIHAAARSLSLSEKDCRSLLDERCESLPAIVETLIGKLAA